MKLTTVQVSNFKCIREPCTFTATDITSLVGKNEAGKTTILEALYRLNPIVEDQGTFNLDDDFPRMDLEDYRLEVEEGKRKPAIVIKAVYTLEQDDLKEIENDLTGIIGKPELVIFKGYENELYAVLSVNEEITVRELLAKSKIPSKDAKLFVECTTLEQLAQSLDTFLKENESQATTALRGKLSEILEMGLLKYIYEKYFAKRVPKFLYFDEFYHIEGHVNIEALIERQKSNTLLESDYPLLGLIELARLDLNDIVNPARALVRNNRLEGASNHLTKLLMKYWSQNKHLEMRFDIRPALPDDPEGMQKGTNLWGHVYNSRHKASTLLGRRSRGFVWFFSFLAWFWCQKQRDIPIILLLDEPGLILHGQAQRDLLRYLEDESKTGHQVIYTTHSPFMVDPRRLDRVRIVEDKSMETEEPSYMIKKGTQVLVNVLGVNEESILPLLGAMGYDLYSSLRIGENNLLVEGVPDLLILKAMSTLLRKERGGGLDDRWTITPVGGLKKIPIFLSLMGFKGFTKLAVLVDIPQDDQIDDDTFSKTGLLQGSNVFKYTDFTNLRDAGVEDMFEIDFYLSLVNAEYGDSLEKPIMKSHLGHRNRPTRERFAAYFTENPPSEGAKFDPIGPARHFVEHCTEMKDSLGEETLARFEQVFKKINKLLGGN